MIHKLTMAAALAVLVATGALAESPAPPKITDRVNQSNIARMVDEQVPVASQTQRMLGDLNKLLGFLSSAKVAPFGQSVVEKTTGATKQPQPRYHVWEPAPDCKLTGPMSRADAEALKADTAGAQLVADGSPELQEINKNFSKCEGPLFGPEPRLETAKRE